MVDLIKRFESMDNVARLSIWIVGWLLLTPIMFVWWDYMAYVQRPS